VKFAFVELRNKIWRGSYEMSYMRRDLFNLLRIDLLTVSCHA